MKNLHKKISLKEQAEVRSADVHLARLVSISSEDGTHNGKKAVKTERGFRNPKSPRGIRNSPILYGLNLLFDE